MQSITEAYRAARLKFGNWAINWAKSDASAEQAPPDLIEVVKMLSAVGYKIRHVDLSPPEDIVQTGSAGDEERGGCRVVVICTKSGLRTVLETVGADCRCPTNEFLKIVDTDEINNSSIITPYNEPTALVVRDLLNSLAHLDLQAERTTDAMSPVLKTPSPLNKNVKFGSVDQLLTSRTNLALQEYMVSTEDLSSSQLSLRNGVTPSSSEETLQSTFCLPVCKGASSKTQDNVELKLQLAMKSIRDALEFYRYQGKKAEKKDNSNESLFKTPTAVKATPKMNLKVVEQRHSKEKNGEYSSRPGTPHPNKKPPVRVEVPKVVTPSMARASTSMISPTVQKSFKKTIVNKLRK